MAATLSAHLQLAEEWAIQLGNTTGRADGKDPEGNPVTALTIQHGPVQLLAVEQNGVLGLIGGIEFQDELRSQVARLPAKTQERMLYAVKQALVDCPRVAWQMQPPTVSRMGELVGLQLTSVQRIERDAADTFNRFADAIQELTTLVVKVNLILGQIFAGATTSGNTEAAGSIYR